MQNTWTDLTRTGRSTEDVDIQRETHLRDSSAKTLMEALLVFSQGWIQSSQSESCKQFKIINDNKTNE